MDVNMIYTIKGNILKAKMESGVALDITRIVAGTGRSNDLESLENLVDIRQELVITGKSQRGVQSMIFAILSNKGLQAGYDLTQIGILANDPDDGEILYRIAQLERAFPISAEKDFPNFVIDCSFTDTVSNASHVDVVVDPSGMVTMVQFQQAIEQLQNALKNMSGGNSIELPSDGIINAKIHLKLMSTGMKWRETWATDTDGEPVPGLLLTENGTVIQGSLRLEDGTLEELTILPEKSGV